MMHGYNPWKGDEKHTSQRSPGATQWLDDLQQARNNAEEALTKA